MSRTGCLVQKTWHVLHKQTNFSFNNNFQQFYNIILKKTVFYDKPCLIKMLLLDVLTQLYCTYLYWDTPLFETNSAHMLHHFWILEICTSIWDLNTDVYAVLGFRCFSPLHGHCDVIAPPIWFVKWSQRKRKHEELYAWRRLQTACVKLHVTDTHPLTLLYISDLVPHFYCWLPSWKTCIHHCPAARLIVHDEAKISDPCRRNVI